MTHPITHTSAPSAAEESEFVRLQMTQAIETFREQINLIVQILTVFVVADVTILGFAVGDQVAGFAIVAAIIPIVALYVVRGSGKFMLPAAYTAVVLEKKYAKRDADWLVTSFVSSSTSTDLVTSLQSIGEIEDPKERMRSLHKQRLTLIDRKSVRIMLISLSLLQIIAAIALNLVYGWRFF